MIFGNLLLRPLLEANSIRISSLCRNIHGTIFLNDSISKINNAQLLLAGLAITISYAVIIYLTFRIDWTRVMGKRWSDPGKDV